MRGLFRRASHSPLRRSTVRRIALSIAVATTQYVCVSNLLSLSARKRRAKFSSPLWINLTLEAVTGSAAFHQGYRPGQLLDCIRRGENKTSFLGLNDGPRKRFSGGSKAR